MITPEHPLPITRQCQLLALPRSAAYYTPQPVSSADLALMRQIDELNLAYPFAGSRLLPWVLVLGIAVFSIGEMTAHPKYYSFVGTVAPADRKAVYMGYAFVYGVFGSLLGSSLGAFLYERMLKPAVGTEAADATARLFWLLFAVLDIVAVVGLVLFARAFTADTPLTRRRATAIMRGVYAGLMLVGALFLYLAFAQTPAQPRVAVQAALFILLGLFGLAMSRAPREAGSARDGD